MTEVAGTLSVPEAARRLEISTERAYELILGGDLEGRPDSDGVVRVTSEALEQYVERVGSRRR